MLEAIKDTLFGKPATKSGSFLWNLCMVNPGANTIHQAAQSIRQIQKNNLPQKNNKLSKPEKSSKNKVYSMLPVGGDDMLVDVVNDYAWTTTPKSGRDLTPYIILREMQPKTGAELQRAMYAFNAAVDSTGDIITDVSGALNSIKSKLPDSVSSPINKGSEMFGNINDYTDEITKELKDNDSVSKFKSNMNLKDNLEPYNNLYNCNYTGWNFKLPYFENDILQTQPNNFANSKNTALGYLADIVEMGNNIAGGIQSTIKQLESNEERTTETPKSYQMANEGAPFNITFPLINTEDELQASANYQLVQLLKYQSRPYRSTRNLIVPVYLYEVYIPGIRYIPYAIIQDVKIAFQGVRMPMNVNILVDGHPTNTTAIIPEAYKITIMLKSLTNETGNFMVESMLNNRGFSI